jgi:hypothetical protein
MDFRRYLVTTYPRAELHQRYVRPYDARSELVEHNGEQYRIRRFEGDDVIYWCEIERTKQAKEPQPCMTSASRMTS